MITDLTQAVLARALDATAMRHRAIANNMANVETPGYRRLEVDFETQMRAALDAPGLTDATGVAVQNEVNRVMPATREDNAAPDRQNGNNVDPEHEMSQLAENSIEYQAVLQAMDIKGAMVRAAIYEGRR